MSSLVSWAQKESQDVTTYIHLLSFGPGVRFVSVFSLISWVQQEDEDVRGYVSLFIYFFSNATCSPLLLLFFSDCRGKVIKMQIGGGKKRKKERKKWWQARCRRRKNVEVPPPPKKKKKRGQ